MDFSTLITVVEVFYITVFGGNFLKLSVDLNTAKFYVLLVPSQSLE
jgi:hypothetical protein